MLYDDDTNIDIINILLLLRCKTRTPLGLPVRRGSIYLAGSRVAVAHKIRWGAAEIEPLNELLQGGKTNWCLIWLLFYSFKSIISATIISVFCFPVTY